MPSVMNHRFSEIPNVEIQRSSFNRSHGLKTTFNAGELIPIFVDEALPGDTFNLSMQGFGRLATPITPFMDNLHMETFFFAVPNRLIWENWEKFNGQQDAPGDSTDYLIPTITTPAAGYTNSSLADYFGIPTEVANLESVNALHFRAYNLIWNEWFRDENLQEPAFESKNDIEVTEANYPIRKRGKRHDYFTSCLPWPQKGEAVEIPLGNNAPVNAIDGKMFDLNGEPHNISAAGGGSADIRLETGTNETGQMLPNMTADLSQATATTINQLREAFQIQRLYERDARGGTRYTEIVRSHFGVTSPDSRLQRPEYLGGGSTMININAVAQTSGTGEYAETPQGNLGAFGTVGMSGHGFNKAFTEHCVIIGLVCIRADLNYQQGLNRMWSRQGRWDFYWPALANIGEQAVLNKEIYADGSAEDDEVFGYQERYAEYRYKPSMITGQMRSNFAQSLDIWHLAQDFENRPVLNSEFIQENPPVERVLAVPSSPHMILDAYFSLKCARPMPTYSVPGMIDHF